MMIDMSSIGQLSDRDLLAQVQGAAARERDATAQLIALLTELDARRLYLAEGCASLFSYCRQILHLSEHAAYHRIEAARAARRFPVILARLVDGTINLTAIGLLAPLLTPQNHLEVLDAARHKSKRDIEQLVARMRPRPDAPTVIRKLPVPTPPAPSGVAGPVPSGVEGLTAEWGEPTATTCDVKTPLPGEPCISVPPPRRAEVKPLAPERYKISFTVDRETHDKLRRAQDLLRHTVPNGDLAAIFDRALTLLLSEISKAKHAATARPRSTRPSAAPPETTRHIPAAVRRAVWQRDIGQCAFVGGLGRCREKAFLEFHHLVPYADGGEATIANLALRCRAHNAYEAEQWYGAGRAPLLPDEQEPETPNVGPATRSGPSSG